MKKILELLMAGILLLSGNGYAQKKDKSTNLTGVYIEGKITDSLIKKRPNGETTVLIQISKYPFSSLNMLSAKIESYEFKVKYNEPFKLKISAPARRLYMFIYYDPATTIPGGAPIDDTGWSNFDNVYILDEGDNIHVDLDKNIFKFSGKGSDKLNCESEIYKKIYQPTKYEFNGFYVERNYKKYIDIINHKMDSCLALQVAIVNQFRPKLGNEMSNIMLANCYGLRYYNQIRGYRQYAQATDPDLYSSYINSGAYRNIDLSLITKSDETLLVQAPLYVDFLFEKIRIDAFVIKDGVVQLPLSIKKSFNVIRNSYRGIIRDKLLALFFLNYYSVPGTLDYMNESLGLTKSTIYKDILINLQTIKSKGLSFYPFVLPDTKGKLVKLSDLGKKVVILDFWYTGCENCINLHYSMKAIHERYKDNSNVVFVSVSIDKDKKEWVKSVLTGRYTDPEDINLYTDGKGKQHPLITTNNLPGYPQVFILKNGKIYSSAPPYPNGKSINEGGTKQYVDLIEAAIADKSL